MGASQMKLERINILVDLIAVFTSDTRALLFLVLSLNMPIQAGLMDGALTVRTLHMGDRTA